MKCKLRRNVILRDWYDCIDKYQAQYGRYPKHVEMSIETLEAMMRYLYKKQLYGLEFRQDVEYAESRNTRVVAHRTERIFFEGVEIYIKNDLENEEMRIW